MPLPSTPEQSGPLNSSACLSATHTLHTAPRLGHGMVSLPLPLRLTHGSSQGQPRLREGGFSPSFLLRTCGTSPLAGKGQAASAWAHTTSPFQPPSPLQVSHAKARVNKPSLPILLSQPPPQGMEVCGKVGAHLWGSLPSPTQWGGSSRTQLLSAVPGPVRQQAAKSREASASPPGKACTSLLQPPQEQV